MTIHYDGMDWPLETFLDAYGFKRLTDLNDAFTDPLDMPHRVMAVLDDGSLITDCAADQLPRGQVTAIRPIDGGGLEVCEWCGCFSSDLMETGNGAVCDDCWDNAEFDDG